MSPVHQAHPAHEFSFPLSIPICQPGLVAIRGKEGVPETRNGSNLVRKI